MYDKYEYDPELTEKLKEFERDYIEYYASQRAEWNKTSAENSTFKQPSPNKQMTRYELLQSCKKATPNGGGYIALGEYYKKLAQNNT